MADIISFPKVDSFEIPANMTEEEREAKVEEILQKVYGDGDVKRYRITYAVAVEVDAPSEDDALILADEELYKGNYEITTYIKDV